MALIQVRELTKLYTMGTAVVRALDGVDLQVERGEFLAITGASGSGKSTMMHLLGCLDRPTAGKYVFDSRDVSDLSDRELAIIRNRRIGFVFQTFNLINRMSAVQNVAVPLFYARRSDTLGPAMRALERVGLAARAQHNPNELSGGERQRVAIARAIVNDPLLLLADEPTGNLDSRTGDQIMEIFRRLNEQGVTIIMVTHEPDIARRARRIVHMRDGRITSDRLTAELHDEEAPGTAAQTVAHAIQPAREAPPPPAEQGAALPARLARGANATLVCGLLTWGLWGGGLGVLLLMGRRFDLHHIDPMKPPAGLLGWSLAAGGPLCASVGLAVTTLLVGHWARRRKKREPGHWSGGRRIVVGLVLGWAAIALWVVGFAINIVKAIGYDWGAAPG